MFGRFQVCQDAVLKGQLQASKLLAAVEIEQYAHTL